jgi:DNA-binding YbaB/EbfC family protein
MSDPFGGLGGMLGGLQQQMANLQAEAEREEVDGVAGGGLVTVRMNGAQEVLAVRIDPKVMDDREMLEDLLRAATNDAVRRSKDVVGQKLAGMAQAMGLPPGLLGG